jgi:hypothetical protein
MGSKMAKGKPGADSSNLVTAQIDGQGLIQLACDLFGEFPVLWGRYFTSTSTSGNVEYQHRKENQPLRDKGIRVLPIARQTKRVEGSLDEGSSDAKANADDIIATFGSDYLASQGGRFFVFLDVEGTPSLSVPYYTGWAQTLRAHSATITNSDVILLPCVYATQNDSPTWTTVATAANAGVECNGAWIARWRHHGCAPLDDWDDNVVNPTVPIPCPVLIWQYADACHGGNGFDCSQTKPGIDLNKDLLNQLILPPPAS